VEFSESYLDSWQCSFLGISSDVAIPDYVDVSDYAMVEITKSSDDIFTFDYSGKTTAKTSLGMELEKLFEIHFPRNVEEMRLRNIQENWLSKVKLFYTLSLKLESEKDPQIKMFLKSFNLQKGDLEVLRTWAACMKRVFSKNAHLQS